MSVSTLAKEHCANWQSSGACLGYTIGSNLGVHHGLHYAKCLLTFQPPQRCAYFEECVAPMATSTSSFIGLDTPKLKADFAEDVRTYRHQTGAFSQTRICPICNERALQPRQRMCWECAADKRRVTNRNANAHRTG